MWPFRRDSKPSKPASPRQLLAMARDRFRTTPVGVWSMESDSGEAIFRDFTLCFLPDGFGWFEAWAPETEWFNCRARFEYLPQRDGVIRLRITAPKASDVWVEVRSAFNVRQNQYGIDILQISLEPERGHNPIVDEWLCCKLDYCSHVEPRPPDW